MSKTRKAKQSSKQLLEEATVRRFMGLAGIGALSEQFQSHLDEMPEDDMEDEFEAEPGTLI